MKSTRVLIALLATALLSACVTPGSGRGVTSDASQIKDQLFKLQKDSAQILARLESAEEPADPQEGTQALCAEAVTRVTAVQEELRVIEEQLLATQGRLDETLSQLRAARRNSRRSWVEEGAPASDPSPQSPPGEEARSVPGNTASSTMGNAAPEDLFSAAYADYSRGHFDLALAGFEAVLRADPEGHLADDSQYWVGETLFAMKRYLDAVAAFDQMIANWPEGSKVPRAHLKKGIALFEARRTTEAVQALEFVITTWPDSDEARIAQEYFRRKGIVQD